MLVKGKVAKGDQLAAFFEFYKVDPAIARPLYPLALAVFIINALKIANQEALDEGNRDQFRALAVVELEGFDFFLQLVRGEFRQSRLEEWEVREAFDIVCAYARDPGQPLDFKFVSPDQQRRSAAALRAIEQARKDGRLPYATPLSRKVH